MPSLLGYVLRRLSYAAVVVFGAYLLTFLFLYLLPGDPVSIMLGSAATAGGGSSSIGASQVQRDALEARYGLDQPLPIQFATLLARALQGDLGISIQTGEPVTATIARVLPATLQLMSLALLFSLVLAALISVVASTTRFTAVRDVLVNVPALFLSVPTFWVGIVFIQIFSVGLHWLPAIGNTGFQSLILPATVIALPTSALFAQVLTRSLLESSDMQFMLVARAKGISERRLFLVHALRNSIMPFLTILGLAVGGLVAGAVIVETVFAREGMGSLLQKSVSTQDLPVVQGIVLVSAVLFAVVSLIVDLLYPLIDHRITQDSRRTSKATDAEAPRVKETAA